MPTYTFFNAESGVRFDDMMSNAEREEFLKKNPHINQIPVGFAIVGDHIMGAGPKQDSGMTENLQRIAASHPGTPLADRYGGATIKDAKTRTVLKKHGAI